MKCGNALLNSLSPDDQELIGRELESVELGYRQPLMRRRCRPDHVYFPEGGLVSVVALSARREQAEVGTIGIEGCTAVEVVLGCERAYHDAVVLIPGPARRIDTDKLLALCRLGSPLRITLMQYAYVTLIQARETALANARGTISQRVARWILLAAEKMRTSQVMLTHDELSAALGVRRAGVTLALGHLAEMGAIHTSRGCIQVLNFPDLVEATKGYYAGTYVPEPSYASMGAE
jgi:CRP-like cAMP-binding protein